VTDSTTAGDDKLLVIDCDDAQNKTNRTIPIVKELFRGTGSQISTQYQPERTLTQIDPVTWDDEEIDVQACDLRKFYKSNKKNEYLKERGKYS